MCLDRFVKTVAFKTRHQVMELPRVDSLRLSPDTPSRRYRLVDEGLKGLSWS